MKKYIDIPLETLERRVEGKCVEGSLRRDQFTGKITFRAYLRQSRMHQKDKLIKKLPWGWVKESMERIKLRFVNWQGWITKILLITKHGYSV